jgi:hypothetical protein
MTPHAKHLLADDDSLLRVRRTLCSRLMVHRVTTNLIFVDCLSCLRLMPPVQRRQRAVEILLVRVKHRKKLEVPW